MGAWVGPAAATVLAPISMVAAAAFALVGLVSLARLARSARLAGAWRHGWAADAWHVVMAAGMVAMVLPAADPLPGWTWATCFGAAVAWALVALFRLGPVHATADPTTWRRAAGHAAHRLVGALGMLLMLAAGHSAGGAGHGAGDAVPGGDGAREVGSVGAGDVGHGAGGVGPDVGHAGPGSGLGGTGGGAVDGTVGGAGAGQGHAAFLGDTSAFGALVWLAGAGFLVAAVWMTARLPRALRTPHDGGPLASPAVGLGCSATMAAGMGAMLLTMI